MAVSVRFVGVAQNAVFCGVGTAWRTRSEVQQDGAVMHDRGEYGSGLRDCCLAGCVRRWTLSRFSADILVKISALAGTEVDAVVMGTCTAPLITTRIAARSRGSARHERRQT
jgi:hypothetical protein